QGAERERRRERAQGVRRLEEVLGEHQRRDHEEVLHPLVRPQGEDDGAGWRHHTRAGRGARPWASSGPLMMWTAAGSVAGLGRVVGIIVVVAPAVVDAVDR